jgi:hypothetical protein
MAVIRPFHVGASAAHEGQSLVGAPLDEQVGAARHSRVAT